jgi:arylsulfatase A-like enzyme
VVLPKNPVAHLFFSSRVWTRKIIIFAAALLLVIASIVFAVYQKALQVPEEAPNAHLVKLPVPGQAHTYISCNLVAPLAQNRAEFVLPIQKKTLVELGVVRTDSTGSYWAYTGEYRFSIFLKKRFGTRTLFETTRPFTLNERFSVQLPFEKLGASGQPVTVICEIEKAEKMKAKEYDAYKDFAFIAPHIFAKTDAEKPNILLISFDTLRPDHLGYSGYERDTSPHIDEFARQNIVFTQTISSSPWTSPAHYSLFTGLNPSAYLSKMPVEGGKNIIEKVQFLPAPSFAEALQVNGYCTIAFTGGGLVGTEFGFGGGFNEYWENNSYINADTPTGPWMAEDDTKNIFDHAIAWLQQNHEKKFFMFLHNYECHTPYENTYFLDKEAPDTLIEQRKALYDGDIRRADEYFGRLMETLQSLDLMSNTIIIFLSDHGEEFYDHYSEEDLIPPYKERLVPQVSIVDHAHSLYDELIRVPLILHIPSITPARHVLDNQVRLIDIAPTILDIVGIKRPSQFQGVSLLELIRSGARKEEPPAVSEFLQMGPERKSIRKDGFKYIWIENPNLYWNFNFRNIKPEEFFNLADDPGELHDLSGQEAGRIKQYHAAIEQSLHDSAAIHDALQLEHRGLKTGPRTFDKETQERLKALGYLK